MARGRTAEGSKVFEKLELFALKAERLLCCGFVRSNAAPGSSIPVFDLFSAVVEARWGLGLGSPTRSTPQGRELGADQIHARALDWTIAPSSSLSRGDGLSEAWVVTDHWANARDGCLSNLGQRVIEEQDSLAINDFSGLDALQGVEQSEFANFHIFSFSGNPTAGTDAVIGSNLGNEQMD